MSNILFFFCVFVAVAVGYGVAIVRVKLAQRQSDNSVLPWKKSRYLKGLTYLLDDNTDAAVETFISAMDVTPDTLETHLALGKLLRRRGEIAGAVKIHQNLLDDSQLIRDEIHTVQLELAKDYLYSGLLDRAEVLLKELIDLNIIDSKLRRQALERLIEVYRDMKEWLLAIDIADRLTERKFSDKPDKWREAQAQFCCELAGNAILLRDETAAKKWIRDALRYDSACVRATLLRAEIEMENRQYRQAISTLNAIPRQNEAFISEMLSPLYECYQQLNDPELYREFQQKLDRLLGEQRSELVLSYASKLKHKMDGDLAFLHYLENHLQHYSEKKTTLNLVALLLKVADQSGIRGDLLPIFQELLEACLLGRYHYRCLYCGFEGEHVHWLCPGCKRWGSVQYA